MRKCNWLSIFMLVVFMLLFAFGCLDDSTDLDLNLNTQDQQELQKLREKIEELEGKLEEAERE